MTRLASIIVNNYNYAPYLGAAIDSALAQTYAPVEVIVVDDGSTDGSREIIAGYGDRVVPVFKPNGGQGSAFNAGFTASRGEVIVFLDSDDLLLPTAMERAMKLFENRGLVKVHWPLLLAGEDGVPTGDSYPGGALMEGDLREYVSRMGPCNLLSSPGGGCAWARHFLERILPLPEDLYRVSPDTYLFELSSFHGPSRLEPSPQTVYRQHGSNSHTSMEVRHKIELEVRLYEHYSALLRDYCRSQGVEVDYEWWRYNCWWLRYKLALDDLEALPGPPEPLAVADAGCWEVGRIGGRESWTFAGPAEDDAGAIAETERLRAAGARYLVIAWPAFWWVDYYAGWRDYLAGYEIVVNNDRVLVYDLHTSPSAPPAESKPEAPAVVSVPQGASLAVYQWRSWPGNALVNQLAPAATRIHATVTDPEDWIESQIPKGTSRFLFHLNCTVTEWFPRERKQLLRYLESRGIRALNGTMTDISKRAIQRLCAEDGLPCTAAGPDGPAEERFMVKTNANYAGLTERLLRPEERTALELPPPSALITDPTGYRVLRRCDIPLEWWEDRSLSVERYIHNSRGHSYRALVCESRVVLTMLRSPDAVRKMRGSERVHVWLYERGQRYPAGAPHGLCSTLETMLDRSGLDFGAIDILENEHSGFYVVDLNPTPNYSVPIPGALEYLAIWP